MICDRFAFIIICFALSGFYPSHSWAAKSNLLGNKIINDQNLLVKDAKVTVASRKITVPNLQTDPSINSKNYQLDNYVALLATKVEPFPSNNSTNRQASPEIDEHFWPFVAMSATSIIALGLIFLLFRKPQKLRELPPQTPPVTVIKQPQVNEAGVIAMTQITQEGQVTPLARSRQINQLESEQLATQLDSAVVEIDSVQELVSALNYYDNSQTESLPIELKRRAIHKLSQWGEYQSIEPLLRVMPQVGAANKNLILEIVKQINQHSFQSINNQLFAALQDQNPEVRHTALRDLSNLYQFIAPAITKIAQMQSDPDYQVRQMAVEILRQFNTSPLPTFVDYSLDEIDNLIVREESEANLHLVAYLLAELDAVDK